MPTGAGPGCLMRVFLAVYPTAQLTAGLTTALDPFRPRLPVKWTNSVSWHFTLQFLGEWTQERVNDLKQALGTELWDRPFALQPAGLGVFPNWRRPKVLFLQMAGDGQLAVLAAKVRSLVATCWPDGPQDLRIFQPHLTLARIKSPLGRDDVNMLQNIELGDLPQMSVPGFALLSSRLSSQGAVYTELGYFHLGER